MGLSPIGLNRRLVKESTTNQQKEENKYTKERAKKDDKSEEKADTHTAVHLQQKKRQHECGHGMYRKHHLQRTIGDD